VSVPNCVWSGNLNKQSP